MYIYIYIYIYIYEGRTSIAYGDTARKGAPPRWTQNCLRSACHQPLGLCVAPFGRPSQPEKITLSKWICEFEPHEASPC